MGQTLSLRKPKAIFGDNIDGPSGVPIGNLKDWVDNEVREFDIGSDKIVLGCYKQKIYAIGSKCPHYGAPLAKGALTNGKIRCPWHGAAFDITNGDIEDFPGMECIPTYKVLTSADGEMKVYPTDLSVKSIERPFCRATSNSERYIIVGSGPAAVICAQTLRQNEFSGRILMITKDEFYPYDRTKCSKLLGQDLSFEKVQMKDKDWYTARSIDVLTGTKVSHVDFVKRVVSIENKKDVYHYTKIFLAPGCRPRVPPIEGVDLKNVFTLHSLSDAQNIYKAVKNKRVVVGGSSFIAMEVAASIKDIASSVTIISRSRYPFQTVLGSLVGRAILRHLMRKAENVYFRGVDEIRSIHGNGGAVTKVLSLRNKIYLCDAVILAMGGVPNTDFIESDVKGSDFSLDVHGYIPVDEHMESVHTGVFAGGDASRFPLNCAVGQFTSIGHWGIASKHGQIAGMSMAGLYNSQILHTCPFFWTSVAGLNVRYAGHGAFYDEILIFGNLHRLKFCALYRRDKRILACCTANCDPIAAKLAGDLEVGNDFVMEFPPYITEVFPDRPFVAERRHGVVSSAEAGMGLYDCGTMLDRVERRNKDYTDRTTQDREITIYEILNPRERQYVV